MTIETERTDHRSIFSFCRMLFRYRYAKKFLRKGSVLDLGCGYGYTATLFEGYQYVGVDYYDEAVSFASQHCPGAEFRVMSVPPLGFEEWTFDNVICAEMIEHLPQEQAFPLLSECYRVLKPGGIFFCRHQTWIIDWRRALITMWNIPRAR